MQKIAKNVKMQKNGKKILENFQKKMLEIFKNAKNTKNAKNIKNRVWTLLLHLF